MTNEQWDQLVENVQTQFKGVKLWNEDAGEDAEGAGHGRRANVIEFSVPNGRFKVVREHHPVVLDKKMHYSHRPGDTARTEYKFSDTEVNYKLRVYKESDIDEWDEVTLDKLGL